MEDDKMNRENTAEDETDAGRQDLTKEGKELSPAPEDKMSIDVATDAEECGTETAATNAEKPDGKIKDATESKETSELLPRYYRGDRSKTTDDKAKMPVIKDIEIEKLIPFGERSSQKYQGKRLEQLMSSIEKSGLITPIIVRPTDGGKYEIICGHNRVEAFKALSRTKIRSDIRVGLSDDKALDLFYDSNLNQQSFSDWKYSQKIEAIKYLDKLTKESSQQGNRTDLAVKSSDKTNSQTSVYNRQKSEDGSKVNNTRDKMARRLGIATATFSKYRSIIKLQDKVIEKLAAMLDDKRLSLEVAYRISQLKPGEIKMVMGFLESDPNVKLKAPNVKALQNKSKADEGELPEGTIREILGEI